MKISVKDIIRREPCNAILKSLSRVFFGKELSLQEWGDKKDVIIDTSLYSDEELNSLNLDIDWLYHNLDNMVYETISHIEGVPFSQSGAVFVEVPTGKAVGIFNSELSDLQFINGHLYQIKNWYRVCEGDYFSMVLTDLGEWCYFDDYQRMNRDEEKDFLYEYYA